MFAPPLASGLVSLGVLAGPAGWIAIIGIGAIWGLITVATSDSAKTWINSLD